ncbi:MAG: hypothetical protein HC860_01935 [Alkalinema sp. RU_4_3]|nr:hypothetical protein [Alkalinema sp. RU_4_3]
MTQQLMDLRNSLLDGRYEDAITMLDCLEASNRRTMLHQIEHNLVRFVLPLIQSQIEQQITNHLVADLWQSLRNIQKLNRGDSQPTHYINEDEWAPYIEEAIEDAIRPAAVLVCGGIYSPSSLSEQLDRTLVTLMAQDFLRLTYTNSTKNLSELVDKRIKQLPGGEKY